MSKRSAAISLFAIGALLLSARYLSAALFGALSEPRYWPSDITELELPVYLGFGALALGAIYLVWGEIEEYRAGRKKRPPKSESQDGAEEAEEKNEERE